MTGTVLFYDRLLARACRLQQAGQTRQAIDALRRLARFPELPATLAEEVAARLGELLLRRRHFRAARRQLHVALGFAPDSARYHFLLGLASHHDPEGDLDRAADHYARALELAPRQIRCLGEAGLLAITRGRTDEGLALLRRAVALAPTDPLPLGRLVEGLKRAGLPDEALAEVRAARFRAPRCPKLRGLASNLLSEQLRRRQETERVDDGDEDAPVVLPFLRVVSEDSPLDRPIREDDPGALPGPHLVRIRPRAMRRPAT